jgi:hypothetical protein
MQRETILSIGAFIENLTIAAAHYGFETECEVLATNPRDPALTAVRLIKKTIQAPSIAGIEARRTVRSNYLRKEITTDDIRHIIDRSEKQIRYFTPSSARGKYLSEGTILANRSQCARTPAQDELADWIRWSDDDAAQRLDGLTPETMEITGVAGWYVRHFYDRNDALTKEFVERSIEKVVAQATTHGGWLVITSDDSEPRTLIDTGRMLQRMLLRVRDKMIAIHPMTQLLEESPWKDEVARELGIPNHVQFILRAGYVQTYPNPVSLRRPPQWFIQV